MYVIQIFLAPDPVSGEHPYVLVRNRGEPWTDGMARAYLGRIFPGQVYHGVANHLAENARDL